MRQLSISDNPDGLCRHSTTSLHSMNKDRKKVYPKEIVSCGALTNIRERISRHSAILLSLRKLLYNCISLVDICWEKPCLECIYLSSQTLIVVNAIALEKAMHCSNLTSMPLDFVNPKEFYI